MKTHNSYLSPDKIALTKLQEQSPRFCYGLEACEHHSREVWIEANKYDSMAIQMLFGNITSHNPKEGLVYLKKRLWTLLTWQPVYLTVLSTHHFKRIPDLSSLKQKVTNASISGYQIDSILQVNAEHFSHINLSAERLLSYFSSIRRCIPQQIQLKAVQANELIIDCLLLALARLSEVYPEHSLELLEDLAQEWINQVDIERQLGHYRVEFQNSKSKIQVKRKTDYDYPPFNTRYAYSTD